MPVIFVLEIALQAVCVLHAIRTGRPMQWIYIIVFLPLAGSIAYFVMEILPELRHSRAARQAVGDVNKVIDPDKALRELTAAVEDVPSVANKVALGQELMRRKRYDDAIPLLEGGAQGLHADDPAIMLPLAEAKFLNGDYAGVRDTLDRLREGQPDLELPQGHLLYARAHEADGDTDAALTEYEALAGYFPGEEARCRYALLLHKAGQVDEAKAIFTDVVRRIDKASKVYFRAQRDWYEVARRNLAG